MSKNLQAVANASCSSRLILCAAPAGNRWSGASLTSGRLPPPEPLLLLASLPNRSIGLVIAGADERRASGTAAASGSAANAAALRRERGAGRGGRGGWPSSSTSSTFGIELKHSCIFPSNLPAILSNNYTLRDRVARRLTTNLTSQCRPFADFKQLMRKHSVNGLWQSRGASACDNLQRPRLARLCNNAEHTKGLAAAYQHCSVADPC